MKKALRYPLIILTLAVFVVLAMVTLVLPEFAAIYKTFNTLPLCSRRQSWGWRPWFRRICSPFWP